MSIEIVVPQIGEAVSELTLLEWFKKEGQSVEKGEVLFSVDADKSVVEVEAFEEGVLERILEPEGVSVMPGQPVALLRIVGGIGKSRMHSSLQKPGKPQASPGPAEPPTASRSAEQEALSQRIEGGARQSKTKPRQRLPLSPRARRLLEERGVPPESIAADRLTGSGPNGLITERDIEALLASRSEPKPELTKMPLSRSRRVIAEKLQRSHREAPHFYLTVEVDMSKAQELREECASDKSWGRPPTYSDLVVCACATALRQTPEINVSFAEEGLIHHESIGIGVAVHRADGLIVPVLREADRRSLREISAWMEQLRQPDFRLKDSHFGKKSMVVSNLGMHGVDVFFPIIDLPDPVILGVGRVKERIVAFEGSPEVRPVSVLSLSADHRVVDGVLAARFLRRIASLLEEPGELMEAGNV